MELFDVFKIPKNPKLNFGEPLSHVCRDGVFHIGLKDLFLKAYLSAKGDDAAPDFYDKTSADKTSPVLRALQSGSNGQGSLHQRMSLKVKLETGEWILALQTPSGAPLWLLRHFLGRLPQPLLDGPHWKTIAEACGASAVCSPGEVLKRISVLTQALPRLEFKILALLALLIRNLSVKNQAGVEEELCEETLNALSGYFTSSIITRPFRPGLHTKLDKKCQPLLVFFAQNWNKIFRNASRSKILYSRAENKDSNSGELHSYFRNSFFRTHKEKKNGKKFIGFESLLNESDRSKKSSDDIESQDLPERNVIGDLINKDLLFSSINSETISSELESLQSFEKQRVINKHRLPESQILKNNNVKNNNATNEEPNPITELASTSVLTLLKKKNEASSNSLHKRKSKMRTHSELNLPKHDFICNSIKEDHVNNQLDDYRNIVKSSSTEYEFFSVPNSENSD